MCTTVPGILPTGGWGSKVWELGGCGLCKSSWVIDGRGLEAQETAKERPGRLLSGWILEKNLLGRSSSGSASQLEVGWKGKEGGRCLLSTGAGAGLGVRDVQNNAWLTKPPPAFLRACCKPSGHSVMCWSSLSIPWRAEQSRHCHRLDGMPLTETTNQNIPCLCASTGEKSTEEGE